MLDVYAKWATRIKDKILFHSIPYNTPSLKDIDKEAVSRFGSPASHGCVRLLLDDAKASDITVTNGKVIDTGEQSVAVGMAMLSHLVSIPFHLLLHGFIMAPSSITTLVTEERVPGEVWFRCTGLGDTSHLYAAGEPLSHYGRYREHYGVDDGMGAKE